MMTATKCAGCDTQFVPKNSKHKYCSPACRPGAKEEILAVPETTEAPRYDVIDKANPLLTIGPAMLSCAVLPTDEGQRLIVTVRTTSSTTTVGLTSKEASGWLAEFASQLRDMQEGDKASPAEALDQA